MKGSKLILRCGLWRILEIYVYRHTMLPRFYMGLELQRFSFEEYGQMSSRLEGFESFIVIMGEVISSVFIP